MTAHAQYEIEIEITDPIAENIDVADLKQSVVATFTHCGVESASLTIVVTDDDTVSRLNQQYRQTDGPTDILSFPAQEDDEMFDLPPELEAEVGGYLGDLIIAYPFTAAQAIRYHNSLASELRLLVVHGTLHLLGYNHETEVERQTMWQVQGEVLQALGDTSTNWEREYEK